MYENLKKLRDLHGMKQQEFGESVGVKKSTYSTYETGKTQPTSDFWIAIAERYQVSIDYLMGFCDDPHGTKYSDGFSVGFTEKELVKAWRLADERAKGDVAHALQGFGFVYVQPQKEKKEKEAI